MLVHGVHVHVIIKLLKWYPLSVHTHVLLTRESLMGGGERKRERKRERGRQRGGL